MQDEIQGFQASKYTDDADNYDRVQFDSKYFTRQPPLLLDPLSRRSTLVTS